MMEIFKTARASHDEAELRRRANGVKKDDTEYLRDLEAVLARNKRAEIPRSLAATAEPKPLRKQQFVLPDFGRSGADDAADRMERRSAGRAAEDARIHEARNEPKRKLRSVDVDSPYGRETNKTDRVEKIVDTIEHMLKSRQIDRGQEAAARMVQEAWALAHGSMRCVLSPAEGSGGGQGSLTDAQVNAGEVLNDVRKTLGELDAPIVIRICGMGLSVEETARMVFAVRDRTKVKDHEAKHVGTRLRMGLWCLARRWRIAVRRGKVVSARGGVAGGAYDPNFGAMSEAERARYMPLRSAAERRDRKLRGKRRGKTSVKKIDGRAT